MDSEIYGLSGSPPSDSRRVDDQYRTEMRGATGEISAPRSWGVTANRWNLGFPADTKGEISAHIANCFFHQTILIPPA
jgi:hypothetical protein